jgi:hypothetical protein
MVKLNLFNSLLKFINLYFIKIKTIIYFSNQCFLLFIIFIMFKCLIPLLLHFSKVKYKLFNHIFIFIFLFSIVFILFGENLNYQIFIY